MEAHLCLLYPGLDSNDLKAAVNSDADSIHNSLLLPKCIGDSGDYLEEIVNKASSGGTREEAQDSGPGLLSQVGATIGSMQRFMKSLSQ